MDVSDDVPAHPQHCFPKAPGPSHHGAPRGITATMAAAMAAAAATDDSAHQAAAAARAATSGASAPVEGIRTATGRRDAMQQDSIITETTAQVEVRYGIYEHDVRSRLKTYDIARHQVKSETVEELPQPAWAHAILARMLVSAADARAVVVRFLPRDDGDSPGKKRDRHAEPLMGYALYTK